MNGLRTAGFLLVLGTTAACRLYSPAVTPSDALRSMPSTYATSAQDAAQLPLERYWELFGSEDLNGLVEAALNHNQSLRAAFEAVRAAGLGARVAWSERFPRIDYHSEIALSRHAAGSSSPAGPRAADRSLEVGAAARYEIDLWGRARAEHLGAKAQLTASVWDYGTARMSLAAEVVLRWIDARVASSQVALLQAQAEAIGRTADLVELRYKQGDAAWTDLLGLRQTSNEIAEQRALAEQRRAASLAEIRLLTGGRMVASQPAPTLPEVPPLPAAGIPADLVLRRPDVQAAWYRVVASAWTAAGRHAERLPTLSLSGSWVFKASHPPGLFDAWIGSLIGNLAGPLFDFFGRKYAAEQAEALAMARLAELSHALLAACRDVDLALMAHRTLTARYTAVRERVSISQSRAQQLEHRYRNGAADYLELYIAELARMEAERTELSARADLLTQRVQLARALGGGWQQADLDAVLEDVSG